MPLDASATVVNLQRTPADLMLSPTDLEVDEALQETARLIERGWCQGSTGDGFALCLFGAARQATRGQDQNPLFRAVVGRIGALIGGPMQLAFWNDVPERTKADVLSLIERARSP